MAGSPASSSSGNSKDGAGLVVRDEKDESRFNQLELVLEPLLSAAVRERRIERRDFELLRDSGSSKIVSSLVVDDSRFDGAD